MDVPRQTYVSFGLLTVLIAATIAGVGGSLSRVPGVSAGTMSTDVELQAVGDMQLAKEIQGFRGKPVLICFWASYSIAGKAVLIDAVSLHKDFREDGIVVLSVCVDPADNDFTALYARLIRALRAAKVTFPSFWLTESNADTWTKRWRVLAPPAFVVLDKNGNKVAIFDPTDRDFGIEEVRRAVKMTVPERGERGHRTQVIGN